MSLTIDAGVGEAYASLRDGDIDFVIAGYDGLPTLSGSNTLVVAVWIVFFSSLPAANLSETFDWIISWGRSLVVLLASAWWKNPSLCFWAIFFSFLFQDFSL